MGKKLYIVYFNYFICDSVSAEILNFSINLAKLSEKK